MRYRNEFQIIKNFFVVRKVLLPIPVAMVRMFGSKIISSGGNEHFSVKTLKERSQMETLRSTDVAWPSSSNWKSINMSKYNARDIISSKLENSQP